MSAAKATWPRPSALLSVAMASLADATVTPARAMTGPPDEIATCPAQSPPHPGPMRPRPKSQMARTLAMWLARVAMRLPPVSLPTPFGKMLTRSLPIAIAPRLTGIRPNDP
jgi:hypothetical protein